MTGRRLDAVAFDIIETTFSLEALRPTLTATGLPGHCLETWFAASLRDAFALAVCSDFRPLRAHLAANLERLLRSHRIEPDDAAGTALLDGFGTLPAHPDAREALEVLNGAGIMVLAVSNGAAATTDALLQRAGLRHLTARVISVDEVGLSKPRPEVYRHAAAMAGVDIGRIAMVAVHPWDLHGAASAGMRTAFVARGGATFPETMTPPDLVAASLAEAAQRLATF